LLAQLVRALHRIRYCYSTRAAISKWEIVIVKSINYRQTYTLINVYRPKKDAEAIKFFQSLSTTLRKSELESDDNIIIRDFSCLLDPTEDKKGGMLIPRQHLINSIENIQSEFSLHDI